MAEREVKYNKKNAAVSNGRKDKGEVRKAKGKRRKKMTKGQKAVHFLKSKLFGIILSVLQLIATIVFLSLLLYLNVLPVKYFLTLAFIALFLSGYTFLIAQSKRFRTMGKVISIIFIALWCVGSYYVANINGLFDKVSGAKTKTDIIRVYVLKDDPAEHIEDAKDYNFGILKLLDRENTDKLLEDIKDKTGAEVKQTEYESWVELVNSLYDGTVNAIALNSAYVDSILEDENYADFEDKVKILYYKEIVSVLDVDTDKDVTNNTFTFYMSGIDTYGSINITSRSDVNIIAVINPDTRQVLLINTPRDYMVPLSLKGNPKDKLTHAGIYGIDVSMKTLGMLYDVDLDYYFRINFSGFEQVIDNLGGIDVTVENGFQTIHGDHHYYPAGVNHLNGKYALYFARERYNLPGGDNDRGKNQMKVITAVINKMASSALLNNFSDLMGSLEGCFQTSMDSAQISSLVRMQLDEGGSWNIKSYAVTGFNSTGACYSMPTVTSNYLMLPNYDTVEKAKQLIDMVYDGKIITDEDLK